MPNLLLTTVQHTLLFLKGTHKKNHGKYSSQFTDTIARARAHTHTHTQTNTL